MAATAPRSVARWGPLAIALTYLLVSWAYIVLSTVFVHSFSQAEHWNRQEQLELIKGLAFVTVTAALLWWLVSGLTTRLLAETERAESLASENRTLFETMAEPAYVYDEQTLQFLRVNEAAVRRYGWRREEFLGLTLRDIQPADRQQELDRLLTLRHSRSIEHFLLVHQDRNGRRFRVCVNTAPLRYQDRAARLVVATSVEELVAMREAVERLNLELEQRVAERTRSLQMALAELQWFTEAVSHDLRRPVEQLTSLARELVGSASERLTPAEAESLRRMAGSAARLMFLIDDLLADRRIGRDGGSDEPVSLVVLVNGVLGVLKREFGRRSEFVRVVEPLHWVHAHRPTLTRVVSGLLRLALRRSEADSPVEVSATADDRFVRLTLAARAGWLTDEERRRLAGLGIDTESDRPSVTATAGTGEFEVLLRSVHRLGVAVEFDDTDEAAQPLSRVTLVLGPVAARVESAYVSQGLLPAPPTREPPTSEPASE